MGCLSGINGEEITIENNPYYDSFLNMRKNIEYLKDNHNIKIEKYLIKTTSIPNFIRIIKESGILSNMRNKKELMKKLNDYTLETNIEIISDYEEGKNLLSKEEDNEFIIVDKKFLEKMKATNISNLDDKKVEVFREKKDLKVRFIASHEELVIIDDNNYGFYKFIK